MSVNTKEIERRTAFYTTSLIALTLSLVKSGPNDRTLPGNLPAEKWLSAVCLSVSQSVSQSVRLTRLHDVCCLSVCLLAVVCSQYPEWPLLVAPPLLPRGFWLGMTEEAHLASLIQTCILEISLNT